MRQASVGIAPEGYPVIGLLAISSIVFGMLRCPICAVAFLILLWFAAWFFRDPERVTPAEEGLAVSPADGRVILITKAEDPISGTERTRISVFMNLFSVHVNRVPVAGKITAVRYWPGKFFNASFDKASTDNERNAVALTDADGNAWTFVQIAGLIARRIVCRAEIGDDLERGERFGLIRFGSRMDIYLPEGWTPSVGLGQQVFAGHSVIAAKEKTGA